MKPTIEQMMKCYRVVAMTERAKTGRPGEETVMNCLRGTRCVCAAAGLGLSASVEELTRQRIDAALASFMARGISRLSAWSYVCQLRGIFARWCRPYYLDAGWEIPRLELPAFRAQPPRYVRPCPDVLARVKFWYQNLCRAVKGGRGDHGELWLAATMMLEFAMRNGDVLRLTDANFVAREVDGGELNHRSLCDTQNCARPDLSSPPVPAGRATNLVGRGSCQKDDTDRDRFQNVAARASEAGDDILNRSQSACAEGTCGSKTVLRHFLSYTPHKTELTSGRHVFWPIHPAIWSIIEDFGGMRCFDLTDEVFIELNRQLRTLGLRGNKGAYELRKICIDHIYQKFGAEMAVSISGDDIRTISRYYADPAQPNIGTVRIVDLL